MTTIGEVVARLRNSIKEVTDDSVYSNRYLWSTYLTALKQLIKQDSVAGKIYATSDVWSPICVELEPVNSLYCNCFCLPYDKQVYRSTRKLPKFLESTDGIVYRWLATPDMSRTFVIVSPFQYQQKSKIKFNRERYAFLHDGYLYTPNHEFPLLSLSAFFEGDVSDFQCEGQTSTVPDPSLPTELVVETLGECAKMLYAKASIPDYLEDAAIKMARSELLPLTQVRTDEHPNANNVQRDVSP